MAEGLTLALVQARFALLAAEATQRLELQNVQRELTDLNEQVEDVVELLLTEVEELGDAALSPRVYGGEQAPRVRDESGVHSRLTRVVSDTLMALRGKVAMFSQLTELLLQTYSDVKRQCEEQSQKVEALTQEVSTMNQDFSDVQLLLAEHSGKPEEAKECRNCKRCIGKITEFSNEIVQLRTQLTKTETLLLESKQAREQLNKELGSVTSRNRELEREVQANPTLVSSEEMLELQAELKRSELTVSALEKELKSVQDETDALRNSWHETEAELEPRESALRKAQDIIKKLNSECEQLTEELHETEKLSETLKRDAHQYERAYREAQIQLQPLDILQKTEIRLREENQALKNILETVKSDCADEVGRMREYIDQLTRENRSFQGQIVELETSIVELDKEAKDREMKIREGEEKIEGLGQALDQKTQEYAHLTQENEAKDEEHEAEIAQIKRIAENTIRSLQQNSAQIEGRSTPESNSRSPMRSTSPYRTVTPLKRQSGVKVTFGHLNSTTPGKIQSNVEEEKDQESPALDYYKGQLEEAAYREISLKSALQDIVTRSSSYLRDRIRVLEQLEVGLRPETERWIMRNEELETRLISISSRLLRTLTINRDLQKMVSAKGRQMEDQKKSAFALQEMMDSAYSILMKEFAGRGDLIVNELIPTAKNALGTNMDTAMKMAGELKLRIQTLDEETEDLRHSLSAKQDHLEQIISDLRRTEDLLQAARDDIARKDRDISHIRGILSIPNGRNPAYHPDKEEMQRISMFPGEAETDQIELSPETQEVEDVIKGLQRDLNRKTEDLERLESKFRELLGSNRDMQQVFEDDKESLFAEIRTLTELKTHLETEIKTLAEKSRKENALREAAESDSKRLETLLDDLRRKLSVIESANDAHAQDRDEVERRYEEAASVLKQRETELNTEKMNNERLLQELNEAHADISTLISYKDQVTTQAREIDQLRLHLSNVPTSQGSNPIELTHFRKDSDDYIRTRARNEREPSSVDRLMIQKEEYIKELEQRLEQGKPDVLGMSTHSSVFEETLGGEVDRATVRRLKNKVLGYKRSFNKRLEEFETVLRVIEDAVNALSQGLVLKTDWPPTSNPTIDAWATSLLQKLSDFGTISTHSFDRELRTYLTLLSSLQTADLPDEEKLACGSLVTGLQKQTNPDLDFAAGQLTILQKRAISQGTEPRKLTSRSYTTEELVCLSGFHARMFLAAIASLDSVEICLIERKESILQVSEELDTLVRSLAETRTPVDMSGKIADMFSKFSAQFLQDLKRDLQVFAEALKDLKDVSRSNPMTGGRGVSFWSFAQRR